MGTKWGYNLQPTDPFAFDPNLQRDIQNIENRNPQTHR